MGAYEGYVCNREFSFTSIKELKSSFMFKNCGGVQCIVTSNPFTTAGYGSYWHEDTQNYQSTQQDSENEI